MPKRVIDDYEIFNGVSLASDQTQAVPTNLLQYDNIGIMVDWTGSSPIGEIQIQCCNDYDQTSKTGSWSSLDFGSPISISGNSGHHTITINQCPYSWLQVIYLFTSGDGSLDLSLTSKPIGGG